MSPEPSSLLGDINASGWDLLWAVVLAFFLVGVLRVARFAIDVVPVAGHRRESLRRAYPIVAGAAGVLYLLVAAGLLFERYPQHFPLAVAVILGLSIAASWFAVRDLVSGIFLKAGRVCRVGDYVRVGEVQGRVERMGHRVLVVETAHGEEAIIPYSRIAQEAVLRTPVAERGTLHVFELSLPNHPPVAEAKHRIRESALRSHWAALAREPEIAVLDAERFEVTIYALDADHVREVEDAVRRGMGASKKTVAKGPDAEPATKP